MIFIIHSESSTNLLGCRTTVDGDKENNTYGCTVNKNMDGVLRKCSSFPVNHLPQFVF